MKILLKFLKEKPERGERQIKEFFEILAEYFNIPIRKIRLVKGSKSPSKIFEIYD